MSAIARRWCAGLLAGVLVAVSCLAEEALAPPVKKSKTGICHAMGSRYYAQTKHFVAFEGMADCLKSGGRLPKGSK